MDLNQLKAFVMVAKTGSLTKASKHLFLSLSAVSAQIKALENELGVILFNRSANGMALTVAGRHLEPDALRSIEAVKDIFSNAQQFYKKLDGECRIGTIFEPVTLRLAETLSLLLQLHSNLKLHIFQSMSGIIIDQLLNDQLDGGYIVGIVDDPRIISIPVSTIILRIVAPYHWKDKIINADWATISELPWIAMPSECSFYQITLDMFIKHNVSPTVVVAVNQESTLRKLVSSGIGLALMREDMALDAEQNNEIIIWDKNIEQQQLYFIYAKAKENHLITQTLLQSIHSVWQLS